MTKKKKITIAVVAGVLVLILATVITLIATDKIGFGIPTAAGVEQAYEIAKENGYEGTLEEWKKAILSEDEQQKAAGIAEVKKDKNGNRIIELDNGTKIKVIFEKTAQTKTQALTTQPAQPKDPNKVYYTVRFESESGEVLKIEEVMEGSSAIAPDAPYKDGFVFKKWDTDFLRVNKNITVKPVFEKITKPAIVVETIGIEEGQQTANVNIKLLNNPGIASLVADISYDDALTLVDVEFQKNVLGKSMVTTPEPFSNPQRLSVLNTTENFEGNGTFATLTFKLPEKISKDFNGDIRVTYKNSNVFDIHMKNIQFDTINGKIIISK